MKNTVLLAILDGVAIRSNDHGNAWSQAKKPNFDRFQAKYPYKELRADSEFVGLPDGQMGNSEVGHLNIGAGRIVYQSLARINKSIADNELAQIAEIKSAIDNGKTNKLHLMGLLSDGGVHSHIDHLFALLDAAKASGLTEVYVHAFLDGRDVDPKSGDKYIQQLVDKLADLGIGKIASISGRYYAMDRDKRWDRVELAYNAVVAGKSDNEFTNPLAYVQASYDKGLTDEFVEPAVNKDVDGKINDNDSIIFFNFRPDRAIQLASVLTNPDYNPKPEEPIFVPAHRPVNLNFVQMMKFSNDVKGEIAFKHIELVNTLGDVVSAAGKKQLRIAETEKYPHVTFFFDGGLEKELPGSKKILINSPKVATYDLKPEMSAYEVTDALLAELDKEELDLVILNFANPDMVGHSGMLEPTIKAVEAVDECLGKIIDKVVEIGGHAIITADHGNSELVLNDDESPNTAHTTNHVPCIVVKEGAVLNDEVSMLADLAPTLLHLMGVEQPVEMTGKSLIND